MRSDRLRNTILLSVLFYISCSNPDKQEMDTVPQLREYLAPPSGFAFDTINGFSEETIVPRLKVSADSGIEKKLRKEIIRLKDDFMTSENEPGSKEYKYEEVIDSFKIRMCPVHIFRDKEMISYCFEMCYSEANYMRPFCDYKALNFDVKTEKVIYFTDYFEINTASDTARLKKLILSAIDREESDCISGLRLDDKLDFSFDGNYVYFFFEPWEFLPFNIQGGVKRKYLDRFIKTRYK